jgi:sulfite reductase (ferredoxin)
MPELVASVQRELDVAGLSDQPVDLRITGCPNGCARPYTAEIGIVGSSLDMYTIYLGASPLGTRMGGMFATNVKRHEIAPRLRPLFESYRETRQRGETFGDYCDRVGIETLKELVVLAAA